MTTRFGVIARVLSLETMRTSSAKGSSRGFARLVPADGVERPRHPRVERPRDQSTS